MVETNIKNLVINKMTQAQYDALEEKDPNQLYYIVDDEIYVDVARLAVEVDAGKQLIAQAITNKGDTASADESLSELAEDSTNTIIVNDTCTKEAKSISSLLSFAIPT